jgi:Fe-Mn family superoxide dismutase
MNYQIRPLTLNPDQLSGLSNRLITSHHENNYSGAVKRLNAIRSELLRIGTLLQLSPSTASSVRS